MFNISDPEMENYLSLMLDIIASKICITQNDYQTLNEHFDGLTKVLEAGIDKRFAPVLRTQGSVRLGTANKPIDENGLDADIICELSNVPLGYTQKDVQEIVGSVLRAHGTYGKLLKEQEGGRRCFTIEYEDGTHVDILPCVVDDYYRRHILDASVNPADYVLKITDKKRYGFDSDTNREHWPKSNPIGYCDNFKAIARAGQMRLKSEQAQIRAAVEPFPKYEDGDDKMVLQQIVQLYKRHRDVMMGEDDDKPVSILLTTLAEHAFAVCNERTLYAQMLYVAEHMPDYIEYKDGKPVVLNPVLPEENFADKWPEKPRKKQMFEKWHSALVKDLQSLSSLKNEELANKLKELFGEKAVTRAYTTKAQQEHRDVRNGAMTMSTATGQWQNNQEGKTSKPHSFYAIGRRKEGYKLMPRKPHLAIEVQRKNLEETYPHSWTKTQKNGFDWFMKMTPKADSLTYTIRMKVRKNMVPEVQVIDPKPLPMAPGKTMYEHINMPQDEQYLCLHFQDDWTPDMRISDTFVPWASEWLLNYEYWLVTGEWEGGGLHRGVYKP